MQPSDDHPKQIFSSVSLREHLKEIGRGGSFIYYVGGNLGVARHSSSCLNALSSLVLTLHNLGILNLVQITTSWRGVRVYGATIRVDLHSDHIFLSQPISQIHWECLKAINDKTSDVSVNRALRDAVGIEGATVDRITSEMVDLKLLETVDTPAPAVFKLSRTGLLYLKPHKYADMG